MKKKMILVLPMILIGLMCNRVVFSQCGGTGYHIGNQYGSKLLVYNCNQTFNCHMFVRMYYESNCDLPYWNRSPILNSICSWDPSQYESPNTYYWLLNTYIKVAEQYANIVYQSGNNQEHSQVKDRLYTSKYISKYDYTGPIVGHNLYSSDYELSHPGVTYNYQYYFYLGKITGPSSITSTSPVNYTVNSSAGVKYTWTASPSGVVSLTNSTTSNVTVTAVQSGQVTLTLSDTTSAGGSIRQSKTINVSVPTPLITGNYDNGGNYNVTLFTVNHVSVGSVFIRVSCPGATTYTWQKTAGNVNAYLAPGPTASFSMTSGGTITILITAKYNSTTITSKSVTFYN
jgi:hypothetical protein